MRGIGSESLGLAVVLVMTMGCAATPPVRAGDGNLERTVELKRAGQVGAMDTVAVETVRCNGDDPLCTPNLGRVADDAFVAPLEQGCYRVIDRESFRRTVALLLGGDRGVLDSRDLGPDKSAFFDKLQEGHRAAVVQSMGVRGIINGVITLKPGPTAERRVVRVGYRLETGLQHQMVWRSVYEVVAPATREGIQEAVSRASLEAGRAVLARATRCNVTSSPEDEDDVVVTDTYIRIARPIHFETNSATIAGTSTSILDRVATVMGQRTADIVRVAIEGHTDSVGSDADNLELSQRRAESVRSYLLSKGVAASRLEARGFGENAPVAPNDTEDGQALNRRVEFHIVERAVVK